MPTPAFLALDWGTTNLRGWVVSDDGSVGERRDFPLGVSRLGPGVAARKLADEVRPAMKAEQLPAILCGMIGSNLGWIEVPYLDCPTGLDDLAAHLRPVPDADPLATIVPGLRCQRPAGGGPDVMRGEETQILGWVAADPARSKGTHLICHPGTHAKWVVVKDGRIERFVTAMTGELFDVLSRHSVLRSEEGAEDAAAFDEGLEAAGDGGALAARLFTARARVVGGDMAPEAARSYLSGLLVGAEVAGAPLLVEGPPDAPVVLIGDASLCGFYRRALERRGMAVTVHDGEAAGLAGLKALFERGNEPMMSLQDAFAEAPIVAIIRGVRPDEVVAVAHALYDGGIRVVEVPMNSPEPLESIRRLTAFTGRMVWGAGTVLDVETVDAVADAGGRITVAPNTDPAVIARSVARGLIPMPGFGSATEAFAAIAAGAKYLKLFPASTYGPDHLRALKAVLPPETVVQPVGGVGPAAMAQWWEAGARGFGLGSDLYKPGRSPDEVRVRAKAAIDAVRPLLAGR